MSTIIIPSTRFDLTGYEGILIPIGVTGAMLCLVGARRSNLTQIAPRRDVLRWALEFHQFHQNTTFVVTVSA
jgi:hypothetical protein